MFYLEFGGETPDMTAPQKVVIGHGHSPPGDESGEEEDLKKQVALKVIEAMKNVCSTGKPSCCRSFLVELRGSRSEETAAFTYASFYRRAQTGPAAANLLAAENG